VTGTVTFGEQYVTGGWLSDNSGAVGDVYNFALTTDDDGNAFVSNGRVYANWSSSITWNPPCNGYTLDAADFSVNPINGVSWVCPITEDDESGNTSTHFVLPGAVPSALTSCADFSTTYGDPQLRVYIGGGAPSLVTAVSASSVVPGVSAVFPFPEQSNGSPLAEGFYGLANTNVTSTGGHVFADASYLAVGGTTTLSSAFGVDAADATTFTQICNINTCSDPVTGTALPTPLRSTTRTKSFTWLQTLQVGRRRLLSQSAHGLQP
jgi:hypothetical protein